MPRDRRERRRGRTTGPSTLREARPRWAPRGPSDCGYTRGRPGARGKRPCGVRCHSMPPRLRGTPFHPGGFLAACTQERPHPRPCPPPRALRATSIPSTRPPPRAPRASSPRTTPPPPRAPRASSSRTIPARPRAPRATSTPTTPAPPPPATRKAYAGSCVGRMRLPPRAPPLTVASHSPLAHRGRAPGAGGTVCTEA